MASSNIVLEMLQTFLLETVAPRIKLLKANDDEVMEYEPVHPQVHIGWLPPKGYLPDGMKYMVPCLIVGFDEADDDGQDATANIRITGIVYRPGEYIPEYGYPNYKPSLSGYQDLLNLIDRVEAELMRNQIINGTVTAQLPIKKGMYQQEQPYPYWYGWLTFTARTKAGLYVPTIAQQYL